MKIVVPIDFSPAAEHALRYTDEFTDNLNIEIVLAHALPKRIKDSDKQERYRKLVRIGEQYILDDAPWEIVMESGDILDIINDLIQRERVVCTVLGSPPVENGVRKFSSSALRLITSAETPFMIVQEDHRIKSRMEHITIPIDLHSDDMRILEAAAALAMPQGSQVHILASWNSDKSKQNLGREIAEVSVEYFKELGVEATVKYAPETKNFDDYLIHYAQEMQSDLIAIPHHGDSALKRMFGKDFAQTVLLNQYRIPVFTLDPKNNFYFRDIKTLGKRKD